MKNPFVQQKSGGAAVAVISIGALIAGFLVAAAVGVNEKADTRLRSLGGETVTMLNDPTIDIASKYEQALDEIEKLRKSNSEMADAASKGDEISLQLNERLQEALQFAGLTEAEGPGITVTLRDSVEPVDPGFVIDNAIIHDQDVIRVVNELWNAGAEAISINGGRVGPRTYVRCVGSVVHVDSRRFASPIYIRAIGEPQTLYGAMVLPGGVLAEIQETDSQMVELEIVEKHRLSPYSGPTSSIIATVPQEDEE
jgi:uncharacterized protein YlxW (UPF0749 family)